MKMNNSSKILTAILIVIFVLLSAVLVLCYLNQHNIFAYAASNTDYELDLELQDNDINNCMFNEVACMTILIHGANEDKSIWCGNANGFSYESDSLIERLARDRDSVSTYVVEMSAKLHDGDYDYMDVDCNIKEITVNNGSYQYGNSIQNFSIIDGKHKLFIYNDAQTLEAKTQSDEMAYFRLEVFINNLIVRYRQLGINNPTINIIAHGRGGILSIKYASKYTNNVANLITVGTNYNASSMYQFVVNNPLLNLDSFLMQFDGRKYNNNLEFAATSLFESDNYKDFWNNTFHQTKVYTIGTVMQYSNIAELVNLLDLFNVARDIQIDKSDTYWDLKLKIENEENVNRSFGVMLRNIDSACKLAVNSDFESINSFFINVIQRVSTSCSLQEFLMNLNNALLDNSNSASNTFVLGNFNTNILSSLVNNMTSSGFDYRTSFSDALKSFISVYYNYSLSNLYYDIDYNVLAKQDIIEYLSNAIAYDFFEDTNHILSSNISIEFIMSFLLSLNWNYYVYRDYRGIFMSKLAFAISKLEPNNFDSISDEEKAIIFSLFAKEFSNIDTSFNEILGIIDDYEFLIDLALLLMDNAESISAFVKTLLRMEVSSLMPNVVVISTILRSILTPQVDALHLNEYLELINEYIEHRLGLNSDEWTGLAKVLNDFKLESDIAEISDYRWYNRIINMSTNDFVFTNDGVNSLSSQLGNGYNGFFERKAFIFDAEDCRIEDIGNINYPIPIPHNVQCQNQKIIQYIASVLNLESLDYEIKEINDTEASISAVFVDPDEYGRIIIPQVINGKTIVGLEPQLFDRAIFENVVQIVLPNTIRAIGEGAFANCINLETINIPVGVTEIKDKTFYRCSSLNIDLSSLPNIHKIGHMAFANTGIDNLRISSTLTSIGEGAFANCQELSNIYVSPDNPNYSTQNGILYSKNYKKIIQYPIHRSAISVTIDDSVETIGKFAFSNSKITSIEFNQALQYIEEYAFANCNIESIKLFDNLSMVKTYAFKNCKYLNQVVIYDNTPNIAAFAFEECAENIAYYVPYNQIEAYKEEPGLWCQEDRISSITYNIELHVDDSSNNIVNLTGFKYGTSLNQSLNEINVHEYVDSGSTKDSSYTYIEKGDYVFDGWRYECDTSGNGTGLNIFNEFDYNNIYSNVTLYAKWRPKQYYLKVEQLNSSYYLTANGMSQTESIVEMGQEEAIAAIYWNLFVELTQLQGKKVISFTLKEYIENANPDEELSMSGEMEHYYKTQFETWAQAIARKLQEIPPQGLEFKTYIINVDIAPKEYEFRFNSNGGSSVSIPVQSYGADLSLPTPTRQFYMFGGWKIKAIVAISETAEYPQSNSYIGRMYNYNTVEDFTIGVSLDGIITLEAIWSAYVINVNSNTDTTINHYNVVHMNFSGYSNSYGTKNFVITSTVKVLYIKNARELNSISFTIKDSIELHLESVHFTAPEGKSAINATDAYIDMYIHNSCSVTGGNRTDVNSEDGSGIVCYNLDLTVHKGLFEVKGGAGKNGDANSNGIAGGYGLYITGSLYIYDGYVISEGGTGGKGGARTDTPSTPGQSSGVGDKGKDGYAGKKGGNGGIGVYVIGRTYICEGAGLAAIGGNGGDGGVGGKGGTGGEGAAGRFMFAAKRGGEGGTGGQGGSGGNSGLAALLLGQRTIEGVLACTKGVAGIGGAGGAGGNGGLGGIKWKSTSRAGDGPSGSPGARGTDGIVLGNLY